MPSWSTVGYALGFIFLAACLVRQWRRAWSVGFGLIVLTAALRLGTAARGESMTLVSTKGGGGHVIARLLDEGDFAVLGARLMVAARQLHDPDAARVPDALASAYARMRAEEGDAPSPIWPTWLGLQSPKNADVLAFEGVPKPRGAVIFLHGYAGNFSLPGWQIARAAREAGLATYCPSVGWRGDWWNNRRTLEKTVALVRRRGHNRIYLAGLSNGAAGAAQLAPRMRGTFRGLILISGAARNTPPPGVPVLLLQGRRDAMFGAGIARAYGTRFGGRYVDLDGGHFAFLLREKKAHLAIVSWLKER